MLVILNAQLEKERKSRGCYQEYYQRCYQECNQERYQGHIRSILLQELIKEQSESSRSSKKCRQRSNQESSSRECSRRRDTSTVEQHTIQQHIQRIMNLSICSVQQQQQGAEHAMKWQHQHVQQSIQQIEIQNEY